MKYTLNSYLPIDLACADFPPSAALGTPHTQKHIRSAALQQMGSQRGALEAVFDEAQTVRVRHGSSSNSSTAAAHDSTVDIKLRIKLHSVKDVEVAVRSPMVKVTVSLSPGSRASDEKH